VPFSFLEGAAIRTVVLPPFLSRVMDYYRLARPVPFHSFFLISASEAISPVSTLVRPRHLGACSFRIFSSSSLAFSFSQLVYSLLQTKLASLFTFCFSIIPLGRPSPLDLIIIGPGLFTGQVTPSESGLIAVVIFSCDVR